MDGSSVDELKGLIMSGSRTVDIPAAVAWWMARGHDVDEPDSDGDSLLLAAAEHLRFDVVRFLVSRGANVNFASPMDGYTALHCPFHMDYSYPTDKLCDMVALLAAAGADVNVRNTERGHTPLRMLIEYNIDADRRAVDVMIALLRAGASLDTTNHGGLTSQGALAELYNTVESRYGYGPSVDDQSYMLAHRAHLKECLELGEAVRRAGGWRSYCMLPHRELLRLRSLRARGRAQPAPATPRHIDLLLKPGLENGVLWHVLSFAWETG